MKKKKVLELVLARKQYHVTRAEECRNSGLLLSAMYHDNAAAAMESFHKELEGSFEWEKQLKSPGATQPGTPGLGAKK